MRSHAERFSRIWPAIRPAAIPLCLALLVCGSAATRARASATAPPPAAQPAYDWQSKGHDHSQNAYVNDSRMSTSIAPKLGVRWMTNLLAADVGGPTVAFNPRFGKTVVYAGNERGDLAAFNESDGALLWSVSLGVGDSMYSTPLVSSDQRSVWVGTAYRPRLAKLNTATGAVQCVKPQLLPIQASVTEGTSASGTPQVFISTIDGPGHAGPALAFRESDCTRVFSSNPYKTHFSGAWASASYGVDAGGRRLIFIGTANPDSTEYALDATTGALDWYFATDHQGDHDIGSASSVSPPGANGLAGGAVYVVAKDQQCYAIDLTGGALLWKYNFGKDAGTPYASARSTAALDGDTLVFGMSNGVYALDAKTGKKLWHYIDRPRLEVISSPAIVGPPGAEVVAFADISGDFHVLKLADGTELYHYQTGNYITASPAYYAGHFLITSADGFLYDFGPGGGNGTAPTTSVSSPAAGSTVPYAPTQAISGMAKSPSGVRAVEVAVQRGGSGGRWYDAATQSWNPGARANIVAVADPGAAASTWTLAVPMPTTGTTLDVYAAAVGVNKLADVGGAHIGFAVAASNIRPNLRTSDIFIAPGASFVATGVGFGANEAVSFSVENAVIGSATSDAAGKVSSVLTLPATSSFGVTPLTATGALSKKHGFTPIDIANAWLQAGNIPEHTGFEPDDLILQHVVSPGGNLFLKLAWYVRSGPAVESSPAVYDGVVYFGNDAGILTAVDTGTAAPLWTFAIGGGAAIRSTPAIDPLTGQLIFTADDGDVHLLAAADGGGRNRVHIGGLPTSPTVHNGTIYVGSDTKALTAIDERTGALKWTDTLAGAVHAQPALDTASGKLVSGDDSGAISAFDAASGKLMWRKLEAAPVVAAPTIVGGNVYVGSTDGKFHAVELDSGKSHWNVDLGTPITTAASFDLVLRLVYVGGADGTLVAVDAASGKIAWRTSAPLTKSAYVGVSAVNAFVLANDAAGSLIAFHSSQAGRFNARHATGEGLTTAPAVVNGAVYVGASDGGVYAFTAYGKPPAFVPDFIRRADALRAQQQPRPIWPNAQPATRQFSWTGQRDAPIDVDALTRTPRMTNAAALALAVAPLPGPRRTYLLFWNPGGTAFEAGYPAALITRLASDLKRTSGVLGGAVVDTALALMPTSDAAIQREIAKIVAVYRWSAGPNTQVLVFTGAGALGANVGFCSYRSAFRPGRNPAELIAYAVLPYSGALAACGPPASFAPTGDPAVDAAWGNLLRVRREPAYPATTWR